MQGNKTTEIFLMQALSVAYQTYTLLFQLFWEQRIDVTHMHSYHEYNHIGHTAYALVVHNKATSQLPLANA